MHFDLEVYNKCRRQAQELLFRVRGTDTKECKGNVTCYSVGEEAESV